MKFYQSWQGFLCDEKGACIEGFNATVPGNIQMDFARHKDWLDTLQFSTNAKKFEPYKNNYWKYETYLDFERESDDQIFFVAEGIDYEFDVLLNGEIFRAELWYINDSREATEDTVTVSVIIGDNEYELLNWDTGEVSADSKKIGPSINFTLPVVFHQNKLILRLKSKHSDRCNEYNLLYRCTVPPPKTLTLNV